MPSVVKQREQRALVYSQRVDVGGWLQHPDTPPHVHGRYVGYTWWGCRCPECRLFNSIRSRDTRLRMKWNRMVIHSLFQLTPRAVPLPLPEMPEALKEELLFPPEPVLPEPVTDPIPVREPAPVREPEKQPETLDGIPIPDIIPALHDQMTIPLLRRISDAYFTPQWTTELASGVKKRVHGDIEVLVGTGPGMPVISFRERPQKEPSEYKPQGIPKAKGGRGGRSAPTSIKDLLKALKARGCTVSTTGSGHYQVKKNGKTITIPSTVSDARSVKNAVAQLRRDGVM